MVSAPLYACGYKVSQDYLRPFFKKNSQEVTPVILSARVNLWYRCLSPEDRVGCPAIISECLLFSDLYLKSEIALFVEYLRRTDEGYENAVYFVHTRLVAITSMEQVDTDLIETEEDKTKKKRFLEVFGRGFKEEELHFEVREWRTYE